MYLLKKTAFLGLLLLITFSLSPEHGKNTVLIIESYHKEYDWVKSYEQGIRKVMPDTQDLHWFYMDTKRIPRESLKKSGDRAWQKYVQLKPDLVILNDDNALKLLGPRLALTKTPVVFSGINNNPRYYFGGDLPPNFTGVLERPLLKRSILFLKKIDKSIKKVLVLFDEGTTARAVLQENFSGFSTYKTSGVTADIILISTWQEWQQTILRANKEYDALIIGLYHTITDDKGNHKKADEIITWTAINTSIPPFGFWDFSIGKNKAIGGLVLFGEEQGIMAARLARQILAGQKPENIRLVTASKGSFLFSRQQLKKFRITLPESIIETADFIE